MNSYERLNDYIKKYKENSINAMHSMKNYYDDESEHWFIIEELLEKVSTLETNRDKAIEYIDRMTRVIDYNDDEFITWEQIEDIEKILRGKDENN